MKNYLLLIPLGLLATNCKKDDAAPTYSTFTSVGGTMAVSKNGAASYNLTNLQLRISHTSTTDSYEYRGTYNNVDGVAITFNVDPKRTGTTATWVGATYSGGFSGTQGNVEGASNATYTNPGASASGTFSGTIYKGSLK